MEKHQEEHLHEIKSQFSSLVDVKYRKGQAEHGGDLMDMGMFKLIDMAIDEAVDQVVYLLTLREAARKLAELK